MAITKYFSAKIASIYEASDFKHLEYWDKFKRRVASTGNPAFKQITLDPEKFVYAVNHSVSAYEYHGPNENGDGFPAAELEKYHFTFIGKPVTVDHQEQLRIGIILDSKYVYPTDPSNPLTGHYVQNVLAIDKELANKVDRNLIPGILDGRITDTSMGALVQYSQCSICNNIAHTEAEYCNHISSMKMRKLKLASGEERLVFEICHDFSFFEDSIIRPFDLGGLAGGRGADPKAKILLRVGGFMNKVKSTFRKEAKPKLPRNVDDLKQQEETQDNVDIPSPDDIIAQIKSKELETSNLEVTPQQPTQPSTNTPQSYQVDEVKKRIKDTERHFVNEQAPEVEVTSDTNLFSSWLEGGNIPDNVRQLIERLRVTASNTNPKYEEAFKRIRDLITQGVPIERAIHIVWSKEALSDTNTLVDETYLIEEALNSVCVEDNYTYDLKEDTIIVNVTNPTDTCTVDNVKTILSKLLPNKKIEVTLGQAED